MAFLPKAGRHYAEWRNFDGGPGHHANVSGLSPWIRHWLVREDEVVAAALARHGDPAAEKFIQEVVWRTYWKRWLEQRPTVWTRYRAAVVAGIDTLEREPDLRARWEQATTGRTGLACFDAWARTPRRRLFAQPRAPVATVSVSRNAAWSRTGLGRPRRSRPSAGYWWSGAGTSRPPRAASCLARSSKQNKMIPNRNEE